MIGRILLAMFACLLACRAGAQAPNAAPNEALGEALAARQRGEHAAALKQLRPLAEKGDHAAQCELADLYAKGQGVKRDPTAALKWSRQAAEGGNAACRVRLGTAYEEGRGVKQDLAEARRWYLLAAEDGDMRAQHSLGRVYYEGLGVPQDYVEAAKWYTKAAEQGDANAQHVLGLMYANGRGVSFDAVRAHAWINLAVARYAGGSPERNDAARHRDQIAAKMAASQLAEAQALARDWQPGATIVTPTRAIPAPAPARSEAPPPPTTAPVPAAAPAPVPAPENQWIYRVAGVNTLTDVAAFLASDYSAVLFRARCEPAGQLVLEYFGQLPLRSSEDPPAITVHESAEYSQKLPLEMQAILRDGQEVREARLTLSSATAEAILAAPRLSIDAPGDMGQPWRAGVGAALKRVVRSCHRGR